MADTGMFYRRSARWFWLALVLLVLAGLTWWVGEGSLRDPTDDELRNALPGMADSTARGVTPP